MAIKRDQFIKECEFARLILRNTISNNARPDIANRARMILNDPALFEKFVMNRIESKSKALNESQAVTKDSAIKIQAFGRVMSWLSFRR